jgi:hypothetical protein
MIVLLGVLLVLIACMGVVILVLWHRLGEANAELEELRPIAPAPADTARATLLSVLDR